MTKNFDELLKTCLNEMQAAPQDPSKDPLLQKLVANWNDAGLKKTIEDALKKIEQNQPKPPQQNQNQAAQQNQPAQQNQQNQNQQKTPGQQNQQQQPNNNAANKPV